MSYIHNKYYCCPKVINAFVSPTIRNNAPSSCRTTLLVLSSGDPMSDEALELLSSPEEEVVLDFGQGVAVNEADTSPEFARMVVAVPIPDEIFVRRIKMALGAVIDEPGHLIVRVNVNRKDDTLQIPVEMTIAENEYNLNAGENKIVEDIPIIPIPPLPDIPAFVLKEGDTIVGEIAKPADSTLTGTSIAVTLTFTLVKCGAIPV